MHRPADAVRVSAFAGVFDGGAAVRTRHGPPQLGSPGRAMNGGVRREATPGGDDIAADPVAQGGAGVRGGRHEFLLASSARYLADGGPKPAVGTLRLRESRLGPPDQEIVRPGREPRNDLEISRRSPGARKAPGTSAPRGSFASRGSDAAIPPRARIVAPTPSTTQAFEREQRIRTRLVRRSDGHPSPSLLGR